MKRSAVERVNQTPERRQRIGQRSVISMHPRRWSAYNLRSGYDTPRPLKTRCIYSSGLLHRFIETERTTANCSFYLGMPQVGLGHDCQEYRSEERRVGKEHRS